MTLNSAGIDPNNLNAVLGYVNEVEKQLIPLKNTIKIHFLRNFTIEPIAPFLKFHCYKAGIQPQLTYSDYGNLRQSILDSQSDLHCTQPDIIVLAQYFDSNDLFSQPWGDFESLSSEILGMLALLIEKTAATILVNTQLPHLWPHLTANTPESLGIASLFESLNPAIKSMAASSKSRIIVTDWERYLQRVGESEGLDSRYWYINKAPFKKAFLTNYAADIARVAKVQSGKLKKCLVLDCDNTLWGGIIGEDGLSGIKLDPNDYPGKIFYDFQQQILALYNRGVMICLCSKNNESDAMLVFDTHPGCVLKRQHLSAYRINWDDKATNITRLSQDLNIGLDSMVFIDDSGIECEWVKETLPQVTVLQVPKDLSQLPALLFKAHCFDTLSLSQEDKHRTQSYQQEQSRKESAAQFSDVEAYLASLQLELDI
ncbi:HAD-IIIC family phosphatase, partial [bacterium]|nr:HAD-IIIC family phosphatase [bacterium]